MATKKLMSDAGLNSMLPVMEIGKSRAKWMTSRFDPRATSYVIEMCFDERGELTCYVECSHDEDGNQLWGGGIERADEGRWHSFAISADASDEDRIGEA